MSHSVPGIMLIEEREIRVASLRPGMYVSRLDRDWIGTPFLLQGFLVQTQEDIDLLGQYCSHVFVDIVKSENFIRASLQRIARPGKGGYDVPDLKAIADSRPHPVLHKIED